MLSPSRSEARHYTGEGCWNQSSSPEDGDGVESCSWESITRSLFLCLLQQNLCWRVPESLDSAPKCPAECGTRDSWVQAGSSVPMEGAGG